MQFFSNKSLGFRVIETIFIHLTFLHGWDGMIDNIHDLICKRGEASSSWSLVKKEGSFILLDLIRCIVLLFVVSICCKCMFGHFQKYFVELINRKYTNIQDNLVKSSFCATWWKHFGKKWTFKLLYHCLGLQGL